MVNEARKKLCFIIGPIGEPDSETRIHADWLLEEIVEPVFSEFPEFDIVRADEISEPGMIDAQVIRFLLDSDLVIADLSKKNANAFYEIGIRHMIQKPIIHIHVIGDKIPFDVSLYRATKFSLLRPVDLRQARNDLKAAVKATLAPGYQVDNPVTRARGQIRLEERASPEQKVLLDQIRALHSRMDKLESIADSRSEKQQASKPKILWRATAEIGNLVVIHKPVEVNSLILTHINELVSSVVWIGKYHYDDRDRSLQIAVPLSFMESEDGKELFAKLSSLPEIEEVYWDRGWQRNAPDYDDSGN
jgi:hypothetical protein